MNPAHIHLMLTHIPVLGAGFGVALLAIGMARHNRIAQQTALWVLVLSGMAAGAAYLTGEGAEEVIENGLGAGKAYLDQHEESALAGLLLAGAAGVLAAITLLVARRERPLRKGLVALTLLVAVATSGTMAWVANLGGQIGHPEIRSGQSAATGETEEGEDHR